VQQNNDGGAGQETPKGLRRRLIHMEEHDMRYAFGIVLIGSLLAVPLTSTRSYASEEKGESSAKAESGHHRMSGWMKEKIGLTSEQSKKLEAAWKEHREAVKALREQMHKAMKKVQGELEIEASDKDIQAALDQAEKARQALRGAGDKLRQAMDSVLTPTQRAKMLAMREKKMDRGMMKGRGHEGCRHCWHRGGRHECRWEGGEHGSRGAHGGWKEHGRGERLGHGEWGGWDHGEDE